MRVHVTETHLHTLFLREVPCALDITQARKAVLDWLHLRLLGPGTSLLEMSARVPADEVFTSPALIPDDIWEAMDAICLEVWEEPPSTYPPHTPVPGPAAPFAGAGIPGGLPRPGLPAVVCRGSGSMVGPSGPSP